MTFQQKYNQMNAQLVPDAELVRQTAAACARRPKGTARLRPILVFAALLLCFSLAFPAFAASPSGYELLYKISPAAAQYFKPVNRSTEDNGIRMEVESVYIHEDTAEIYISLTDLTGDRIDETTDLFDSYRIHRPFDCAATCSLADYDAQTHTARFLISIREFGGQKIEGDKLTFSVRRFLSGKREFEGLLPELDLIAANTAPNIKAVEPRGFAGSQEAETAPTAMVPGEAIYSPVSGVDVTGIGYVNGQLHIQLRYADIANTDNHGYIWLQTADGEMLDADRNISFWGAEQRDSYEEYIYDISSEALESCSVYGYFVTCASLTEGNWEITFPLTETE